MDTPGSDIFDLLQWQNWQVLRRMAHAIAVITGAGKVDQNCVALAKSFLPTDASTDFRMLLGNSIENISGMDPLEPLEFEILLALVPAYKQEQEEPAVSTMFDYLADVDEATQEWDGPRGWTVPWSKALSKVWHAPASLPSLQLPEVILLAAKELPTAELVEEFTDTGLRVLQKVNMAAVTVRPRQNGKAKRQAKASKNQASSVLGGLQAALKHVVLDQVAAIEGLIQAMGARRWLNLRENLPEIYVLVGPGDAGVTLTTQVLEQVLKRPTLRIDCRTYSSRNEMFGLTGLRKGYSEAAPGALTAFVKANPTAMVVFDHVECAHPAVQDVLSPLFTTGTLTDQHGFDEDANAAGDTVSFAQSLLIFTTRVGADLLWMPGVRERLAADPGHLIGDLREAIRTGEGGPDFSLANGEPERFALGPHLANQAIMPFQPLGIDALVTLVQRHLQAFAERLLQCDQIVLAGLDQPALALLIALSHGPEISAKELSTGAVLPLAKMLVTLGNSTRPAPARWRVEVESSAVLDQWDGQVSLRTMFRRGERMAFEISHHSDAEGGVLRLHNIRMERVRRGGDHVGVAALQTELPDVRFDQIAGLHTIRSQLTEVAEMLRDPDAADRQGLTPPRGILLFGAPGGGKTLLAKALATHASMPMIVLSGTDARDPAVVKQAFSVLRRNAPSILFLDEIDALGRRDQPGSAARAAINQLLVELDGFNARARVVLIAASNLPDEVDPALLRKGRIDLSLEVPKPDAEARAAFIRMWQRNLPCPDASSADAWNEAQLVVSTAGLSGADMAFIERALRLARHRHRAEVIPFDWVMAEISRLRHGAEDEVPAEPDTLARIAYHEAGHAVVSRLLDSELLVERVSIIRRTNGIGGFTAYVDLPHREYTAAMVHARLCVLLAGRVAQTRAFPPQGLRGGDGSGAAADLKAASQLLRSALIDYGLDPEFGEVSLELTAEDSARLLLPFMRKWLQRARYQAQQLVDQHWSCIERVVQSLLRKRELGGAELDRLMATEDQCVMHPGRGADSRPTSV